MGKIETVSYTGDSASPPFDFTLAPGAGYPYFAAFGASCKVTLTKGSPKKVRGVAIYRFSTPGAYVIPIQ